MKTKFLKIGLPIMVFMMAIAFAFASSPITKADEDTSLALVPGYIMQSGRCVEVTTCSDKPGPLCVHNGLVASTKINETQCGFNLFHWANGF